MSFLNLQPVHNIFKLQVTLTAVLAFVCGAFFDFEAMLSAVLGGIIGIVPGLLFALIFFKKSGAQALKQVVWNFYGGEVIKFMSCVILFTGAFQWSKLKPAPMLMVYVLTMLAYWLSPLMKFLNTKGQGKG